MALRKLILLLHLLVLTVSLGRGQTSGSGIHPLLVANHLINYTTYTSEMAVHSTPSQIYINLGSRYVETAVHFLVPAGHIYDTRGVEVDFMIGRRSIGSTAAYAFNWEISSMTTANFSIDLRVHTNCHDGGNQSMPCGLINLYSLSMVTNASSIYLLERKTWGNIYRASFILPTASNLNNEQAGLVLSAVSTLESSVFWLIPVARLASQDTKNGYEYSFRLPVHDCPDGNVPLMALDDPNNLLGYNYTTWTVVDTNVSAQLFAGMATPLFSYRVAAYDTLIVLPETPVVTPEPVPSSTAATPVPSDPVAVAPEDRGLSTMTIVGICLASLAFICMLAFVGFVLRLRHRRANRAYAPLADRLQTPYFFTVVMDRILGRQATVSGEQELKEVSTIHLEASDAHSEETPIESMDIKPLERHKNQAVAPLSLAGMRVRQETASQFDASGNILAESPRQERNRLADLIADIMPNPNEALQLPRISPTEITKRLVNSKE